jgi:hypothetical protein
MQLIKANKFMDYLKWLCLRPVPVRAFIILVRVRRCANISAGISLTFMTFTIACYAFCAQSQSHVISLLILPVAPSRHFAPPFKLITFSEF